MKRIIGIVLTLTVLLTMVTTVLAGEFKKELLIGYTEFAPYNYTQNGELTGFDTELAKHVCSKLGLKPKFVEIDWDAKETELNSGNIDCVWNALTTTEERRQVMSLTDVYITCLTEYEGEEQAEGYAVAFKKGNELANIVNNVLSESKSDGTISNLALKYGIKEVVNNNLSKTDSKISVMVNGGYVNFDTDPIIIENRTFVPIRAVCEKLGADVYWDETEQAVVIVKNDIKIILEIDSHNMTVVKCKNFEEFIKLYENDNEESVINEVTLDVAPVIYNNRTLLPIRAVCEALGTTVEWKEDTQSVQINCDTKLLNEKNEDKTFFNDVIDYASMLEAGTKNDTITGNIEFTDAEGNVIIDKSDILSAKVKQDEQSYYVELTFTPRGRVKFAEATMKIANKTDGNNYISICVNGEIVSAPRVQAKIDSDTCIITGSFTKETANELANIIVGK